MSVYCHKYILYYIRYKKNGLMCYILDFCNCKNVYRIFIILRTPLFGLILPKSQVMKPDKNPGSSFFGPLRTIWYMIWLMVFCIHSEHTLKHTFPLYYMPEYLGTPVILWFVTVFALAQSFCLIAHMYW